MPDTINDCNFAMNKVNIKMPLRLSFLYNAIQNIKTCTTDSALWLKVLQSNFV